MSEPELRRAVEATAEKLVRQGRPQLAQRVGAQLERLLEDGKTPQALALIGLFAQPSS